MDVNLRTQLLVWHQRLRVQIVQFAKRGFVAHRGHEEWTMTRLLEDKREDKPRKKFLGIF